MSRPTSPHPTELELEILKILWETGPAPVRQVQEALRDTRELAYTSVMTIMGIMTKKGYLRRTKKGKSYIYCPHLNRQSAVKSMFGDLVDRLFDGSAGSAVLHLLETGEIDDAELKELRAVIQQKAKER